MVTKRGPNCSASGTGGTGDLDGEILACLESVKDAIASLSTVVETGDTNISNDLQELCNKMNDGVTVFVANQPQIEGLSLTKYCNEEGAVTGFAGLTLDELTGAITPYYFDATMTATNTPPTGEPCGENVKAQNFCVSFC